MARAWLLGLVALFGAFACFAETEKIPFEPTEELRRRVEEDPIARFIERNVIDRASCQDTELSLLRRHGKRLKSAMERAEKIVDELAERERLQRIIELSEEIRNSEKTRARALARLVSLYRRDGQICRAVDWNAEGLRERIAQIFDNYSDGEDPTGEYKHFLKLLDQAAAYDSENADVRDEKESTPLPHDEISRIFVEEYRKLRNSPEQMPRKIRRAWAPTRRWIERRFTEEADPMLEPITP